MKPIKKNISLSSKSFIMNAIQLCSDAKFTNVAFTNHLVVNNSSVIDNKKNINCNDIVCNTLYYNTLIDNYEENPGNPSTTTRSFHFDNKQQQQNSTNNNINHNTNANTIGGYMNECDGEYSIILGGQYNECTSDYSVVIGGSENQCHGSNSVVMGTQGIGAHSNTFLWNGSETQSVMTTLPSQCMLKSDHGLMFSTPSSSMIMNSHIPENMACFCWDPIEKSMCIRSCHNGEYYKTFLTTVENHLQVHMEPDGFGHVRVQLQNADGNT